MTIAVPAAAPERSERTFFFIMAAIIAATIVLGFGSWALRGNVQFPVPLYVHLHGAVFLSWVGIFVTQTVLIRRNQPRLHRTIGWIALAWAVLMVVVGTNTAINAVALGRVPPFFTPSIFLALSFMELASFVVLLGTAIVLRKRSDWHRRLMLGSTIALVGPAWGRILPMTMLGSFGGPLIMAAMMLYAVAGMFADLKLRGKIHPAYYVVLLALVVENVGTGVLANTPPVLALAQSLTAR